MKKTLMLFAIASLVIFSCTKKVEVEQVEVEQVEVEQVEVVSDEEVDSEAEELVDLEVQ